MKDGSPARVIYRKDYVAYPWHLINTHLLFEIDLDVTIVHATMEFEWQGEDQQAQSIVLNGSQVELLSLHLNDRLLTADDYSIEGETLTIKDAPSTCVLKSKVRIHPAANTALEGLYKSGEFLLTQCEAQGFRKITW